MLSTIDEEGEAPQAGRQLENSQSVTSRYIVLPKAEEGHDEQALYLARGG
jgi:hypothetical protein